VPLLQGRGFAEGDDAGSPPVALVTRTFAERYWPGRDPIGRRVGLLEEGAVLPGLFVEVVGVTGDLAPNDIEQPPQPTFFLPLAQRPGPAAALLVRAADPTGLAAGARRALRDLDPELPLDARTMVAALEDQRSSDRTLTGMFAAFALIALVMAGAGLYAVVSYSVAQRSQEIGIRMALGAEGGSIRRMVLSEGLALALVSLGLGVGAGYALCRSIESLLFGVSPGDPLTYASVAVVLAAVVALGSAIPAWRATRVDPIRALRVQ
jgi:putative ABC transport system permease protein